MRHCGTASRRGQPGLPGPSQRATAGGAMRFQMVCDPGARSDACHRLASAAARRRAATVGTLAAVACGLAMTACGSQNSPGAASSAGTPVVRQRRRVRHHRPASAPVSPPSSKSGSPTPELWRARPVATSNSPMKAASPCHLTGWPAVTGLSAAGTATPLRHAQSTMFGAWHYVAPPPVVTLQPGNSAYAVVAADDQPARANTRCPAPYVRLQVSPPGDSQSVTISAWLPGAGSFLPACTSADGSPTAETSAITTLSSLPH